MSVTALVLIYKFIDFLLQFYSYAIIVYIFMSWLPGARESVIGQWLGKIVEPYLEMFRKIIPPFGMFDFSPIVAIFILNMFRYGLGVIFYNYILPLVY